MKYYLAYGSNLNIAQMARRCPGAVPVNKTELNGYKLVFRRGFLTIEPEENSSVPVGIWRISEENERALDRYEGFPSFYRKETMMVEFEGAIHTEVPCLIYIMNDGFPIRRPTTEYLLTVRKGYMDFGFDIRLLVDADMHAYYTCAKEGGRS